jgi:hypothetical protein
VDVEYAQTAKNHFHSPLVHRHPTRHSEKAVLAPRNGRNLAGIQVENLASKSSFAAQIFRHYRQNSVDHKLEKSAIDEKPKSVKS